MKTLLAIESSCDETSAAVIRDGVVLSNIVASQLKLHAEYGGVVPELATREHLRNLTPIIESALGKAGVKLDELDAIAATRGPGLPHALMVGLRAAEALAYSRGLPFIGVHHHEAHLYSAWIEGTPPTLDWSRLKPSVSLVVSGGHTMLVHLRAEFDHHVFGSTVDDAAGECFDKTAKMLGLPYPGGPHLERIAQGGNAKAHTFPRPMIHDSGNDFSFSGLKTSVRYYLRDHPTVADSPLGLKDLCASVQSSIVDVLAVKTVRAARKVGVRLITAAGGVTCNQVLRQRLLAECVEHGLELKLAAPEFCTDNAAMIGVVGLRKLQRDATGTSLDAEPIPGWAL